MSNTNEVKEKEDSYLTLIAISYDDISFKRKGFKNNHKIKSSFAIMTFKEGEEEHDYRVAIKYKGNKKDEYEIEIIISGYFHVEASDSETEKYMVRYNTVNILIPILRAQIATLTTQFEVDPVILPIINSTSFVDEYYMEMESLFFNNTKELLEAGKVIASKNNYLTYRLDGRLEVRRYFFYNDKDELCKVEEVYDKKGVLDDYTVYPHYVLTQAEKECDDYYVVCDVKELGKLRLLEPKYYTNTVQKE